MKCMYKMWIKLWKEERFKAIFLNIIKISMNKNGRHYIWHAEAHICIVLSTHSECPFYLYAVLQLFQFNAWTLLKIYVLWLMLTNQNSIQKEIKSRLKLGNACYHSVQNLFSSSLLSKNLKIKIYTYLLTYSLHGAESFLRS